MPSYLFFWYDENREHVEEHGVTIDEFEAIVCDPLDVDRSHSSDRLVAFGYTADGRKLYFPRLKTERRWRPLPQASCVPTFSFQPTRV